MAYVDAPIVIDALGPAMMKTANGRKRLPLNNSNSSARSAARARNDRKNVVSSSLTFLRRRADAIRTSLRDRSDRSRAQRFAGTAFLIRAASGAMGDGSAEVFMSTRARSESGPAYLVPHSPVFLLMTNFQLSALGTANSV